MLETTVGDEATSRSRVRIRPGNKSQVTSAADSSVLWAKESQASWESSQSSESLLPPRLTSIFFAPVDQVIGKDYYLQVLRCLRDAVRVKVWKSGRQEVGCFTTTTPGAFFPAHSAFPDLSSGSLRFSTQYIPQKWRPRILSLLHAKIIFKGKKTWKLRRNRR